MAAVASLSSLLPAPAYVDTYEQDAEAEIAAKQASLSLEQQKASAAARKIPPYGQRRGWKPTSQEDFG